MLFRSAIRASPATVDADSVEPRGPLAQRSSALMRVNHCGEVCAQALYEGQQLSAKEPATRTMLRRAAQEELDHLVWARERLNQLGGRPSILAPAFCVGAFAIGYVTGCIGDRWSLAFLAETERQVEQHLVGHLARVPELDRQTRAILIQMIQDETRHGREARERGAAELPTFVSRGMRHAAALMTTLTECI